MGIHDDIMKLKCEWADFYSSIGENLLCQRAYDVMILKNKNAINEPHGVHF